MGDSQPKSFLLSIFLVVVALVSLLSLVMTTMAWHRLVILFPFWAACVYVSVPFLRLSLVAGVWFKSKAAVVAYVVLACVDVATCIAVQRAYSGLFGAVSATLLVALTVRYWRHPANAA